MSGSNSSDLAGIYNTKGVGSPSSVPGGRYLGAAWSDEPNGELWLCCGYGFAASSTSKGASAIVGTQVFLRLSDQKNFKGTSTMCGVTKLAQVSGLGGPDRTQSMLAETTILCEATLPITFQLPDGLGLIASITELASFGCLAAQVSSQQEPPQ